MNLAKRGTVVFFLAGFAKLKISGVFTPEVIQI